VHVYLLKVKSLKQSHKKTSIFGYHELTCDAQV
jgi:hypothetical protein